MKKHLTVIAAAVIALSATFIFSGCGGKKYELYTNIPEKAYEKMSDEYSATNIPNGTFGALNADKEENYEGYTTKTREWFGIINTDLTVNLYVSDIFTDEAAVSRFNALCDEVSAMLQDINYSLSASLENSSIYAFNNAEAGAKVEITQTAYTVLEIAKNAYEFTEGHYNPAVYYSVQAYGFGSEKNYPQNAAQLPSEETISKYNILSAAFADLQLVKEDGETAKFYAVKPSVTVEVEGQTLAMKLDLGGIGKGYAADLADKLMDKYGFKYGHFDFGGSSNVYKSHYAAGNYTLGVADPRNVFGGFYIKTDIAKQSLSTSGDNALYYVIDNVRYCHVINPQTGKPVQTGVSSATIIGGSAAESDAYTTAIMAMGKDKAIKFISEKLCDRRVVFTYDKASAQTK